MTTEAPHPEPQGYRSAMGYVKSNPLNNDHYVSLWRDDPWYYPIKRAHDEITKIAPGYNISQIKAKFNSLRFYLDLPAGLDGDKAKEAREWASWAENFTDAMEHGRAWEQGKINNTDYEEDPWWADDATE